ncbi:DUF554 domain-containing protein [Companilactobacillus sp.]|uniref:DUF554 domain-containing protein n=1 Tax=Companilactobacillus sp. TaxID=2767905 RepID=UPI0025B994CE|nr:DUF554 domain-containing protein [Companilactobacillus sp.]MCH4009675.1 DUF554 domain-containing protein [Companilactobacillus sp.]MCH4052649.1 DUF554 domain-containing protein [Companilactobacillus sp.]MCH4077617.1 DUF554 domain-containing protein [Companilactobacillus sp.]MCH4126193.1 DUF554 domain-containing protein [Companilactobacillus sp.]MCI1311901.1 DUF554 domain-containing protein [Companilactobacillus sp.]
MPIGVIVNVFSIFFGGLGGALIGHIMSDEFKNGLNMAFSICSITMGIYAIAPMKNLAAVIFAVVIGTGLGIICHFGKAINRGAQGMQQLVSHFLSVPNKMDQELFDTTLVTIIVLFCASGTGIYGTLTEGISGDATILISKSILDFFCAFIFGASLGAVVSLIAVPQFIILMVIFSLAQVIVPLTTPDMILDFKAAGGVLMLASGFRIAKIKMFPTADMIPIMLVIMPISSLWEKFVMPLLH